MRSNCFFFALALYLRRRARGKVGYLMLRRSWAGPFPHFIYVELQGRKMPRFVSYCPLHPKQTKILPPPLFAGFVRWGDQRRVVRGTEGGGVDVLITRSTPSLAALADPFMVVTGDTPAPRSGQARSRD